VSTSFREPLHFLSAVLKTHGTAKLLLTVPDIEEKPNITKYIYSPFSLPAPAAVAGFEP
jgi:hypothetical protein